MTTLFIHQNCFDGVVSGAVASWLLQVRFDRRIAEVVPIDYDKKREWKSWNPPDDSCIVDFLYHPEAKFWWDHHQSTFIEPSWEDRYRANRQQIHRWDPDAPSCAGLIGRHAQELGASVPAHLRKTIRWADVIDSANYVSPEEAVSTEAPAKQLALSLAVDHSTAYHHFLVKLLASESLESAVAKRETRDSCRRGVELYQRGLHLMQENIRLERDVVLYELNLGDEIVDRMMPYLRFPEARYSLGIINHRKEVKLTANASPWAKPRRVHLGELFATLGGGGHRDVGSVLEREGMPKAKEHFKQVLNRLLEPVPA